MAKRTNQSYYKGYSNEIKGMLGTEVTQPETSVYRLFNSKKNQQNGSKDTKILEITDQALAISKVCLKLSASNSIPDAVTKKKQRAYVMYYLDADEAIRIKNDINSGRISRLVEEMKVKNAGKNTNFAELILPDYSFSGGDERNGIVRFKSLSISYLPTAAGVMINASIGPGKKSPTGGYVSAGKQEEVISVSIYLNPIEMKKFARGLGVCDDFRIAQYCRQSLEQYHNLMLLPELQKLREENQALSKEVAELKDIVLKVGKVAKDTLIAVCTNQTATKQTSVAQQPNSQQIPVPQPIATVPVQEFVQAPEPVQVAQVVQSQGQIPMDINEDDLPF